MSLATFQANLQALITAAKVSGDCVMFAEAPSAPTRQTQAIQDQYNQVMADLAASNGCAFFDFVARGSGYAAMAAQGYYVDDTHLRAIGYAEEGFWLGDTLGRI
ncbi:SGNH/GDSL hydrolase family protein [Caulobacter sp. RL271]|uniref:SGNH/GDSL hydrolase family protein n=1 Tax=Caulobacter segnis TaxID=88688 RepID=A0ABY4ZNK7_9CAUL|nr:SGNH/GDSL hydrolase family protein [Caulobacter segnis]USQ94189.1 SGNH/GDSL hydrolase family protein [Caulobacter segnis]